LIERRKQWNKPAWKNIKLHASTPKPKTALLLRKQGYAIPVQHSSNRGKSRLSRKKTKQTRKRGTKRVKNRKTHPTIKQRLISVRGPLLAYEPNQRKQNKSGNAGKGGEKRTWIISKQKKKGQRGPRRKREFAQ